MFMFRYNPSILLFKKLCCLLFAYLSLSLNLEVIQQAFAQKPKVTKH